MRVTTRVRIDTRRLNALRSRLEKGAPRAIAEVAGLIRDEAKQRAPVATGQLRDSIHVVMIGDNQAEVGTDLKYGLFQELGTRFMAAQPWLMPAFLLRIKGLYTRLQRLTRF